MDYTMGILPLGMMPFFMSLILGASILSPSASAHTSRNFMVCRASAIKERYNSGYVDNLGNYVRGSVSVRTNRIPCLPMPTPVADQLHYPYHQQYQTMQQPQYQQSTTVHNQQPPSQCNGKLARMVVGGAGGGALGYYVVGGKKSGKTLLGTAIGSTIGAVLGRITC